MPALFLYLLKVNVALLLFCLGYYAALRRLTFYTLNRVYLIIALAFSTLYPTINFTEVVEQHQQLARPLQIIIIDLNAKVTQLNQPAAPTNYWEWAIIVFWLGVSFMTLRLMIQFWSLYRLYHRSKPGVLFEQPIRFINDNINPFSFWQSIYLNPNQHNHDELPSIIAHEQIHVRQWHTLDVLFAELSLIFYWFNPGVWLLKKAISENLEFITDREILQKGVDAKSYQYSLLYTSFNTSSNAIVNHFNISTIKKRIMMMNSKKSSAVNLTRYGIVVPAALALLFVFGTSKASLLKNGLNMAKDATHKVLNLSSAKASDTTLIEHPQSANAGLVNTAHFKATKPVTTTVIDTTPQRKLFISVKNSRSGIDSALYVINGKPAKTADITHINPDDISSINILTSSSAAKLFGVPGSKGAVIVITKGAVNSSAVLELQNKIEKVKGTGNQETTGVATIKQPESGVINSIAILEKPNDPQEKMKELITAIRNKGLMTDSGNLGKANITVINQTRPVKIGTGVITNDATHNNGDPIYIVDGKEIEDFSEFKKINPNSIENITVLKDESAKAIYGKRAINGVVFVTTTQAEKK